MSKIRVYELARELNLTNKVLMDKIQDLGITIGSHMSSLDDEAVQRVKAAFYGKKEAAVEETRIKPTVIRRRRKVTETVGEAAVEELAETPPSVEAAPKAPEMVPETETLEAAAEPVSELPEEPEEAQLPDETVEAAQPAGPAEERPGRRETKPPGGCTRRGPTQESGQEGQAW
jgi:translation initiation factor IF-2